MSLTFNLDTKTWITSKGNRLSEYNAVFGDWYDRAEVRAWPSKKTSQSISHTGDWGATELEHEDHFGKRPKFGEQRTLEALEKLIDEGELAAQPKEQEGGGQYGKG